MALGASSEKTYLDGGVALFDWVDGRALSHPLTLALAFLLTEVGLRSDDFRSCHDFHDLSHRLDGVFSGATAPLGQGATWLDLGVSMGALREACRPASDFAGYLLGTPSGRLRGALGRLQTEGWIRVGAERILSKLPAANYYNNQHVASELSGYLEQAPEDVAIADAQFPEPAGDQRKEKVMDPTTVMTAIASGLTLVDKFVGLVRKLRSSDERPYRVETKQEADSLVVRRDGQVVERVSTAQIRLNEWDAPRFSALRDRVASLWNQFNGLYAQLPNLSVDEQVRIKQRMETMRRDLCKDFREMVGISEKVLGVALDDHYTLYSTCNDEQG